MEVIRAKRVTRDMVRAIEPGRSVCFCLPDGRRLIRTAYLFVPRKFSKTTSCAALAVYDMLFGDNNAQAYVGANRDRKSVV